MSNKLVLIDGHSILNRTFYGIPELTNSEGLHTNAVYGFLNILFKLLDEENADYCIVAFDVKHPTFRHEMYSDYKGTRKPMPEELRQQVPLMKEVLKSLNIMTIEMLGYEADDILGTLSRIGEESGCEVSVLSGDRDLLQLATQKVKIRIPKTKKGNTEIENYNDKDVETVYGVTPEQFIDVKALMGDTADNIPGVLGIGEKTATKLISEYKSVENVYENIDQLKKSKMKENIENGKDSAFLSKKLATIDKYAPVDIDFTNAVVNEMYNEESFKMMNRLEFKSILNKFSSDNYSNEIEETFKTIDSYEKMAEIINNLGENERTGINVLSVDGMAAVSITIKEGETYCSILSDEKIISDISNAYNRNVKFNILKLKDFLKIITPQCDNMNVFDVGLAAYLINPLKDNYDYDDIARDYLSMTIPSENELLGKIKYTQAMQDNDEHFIKMMCYCSYVSFAAGKYLLDNIEKMNMRKLYDEVELPLVYALDRMEKAGIKVEKEELVRYGQELKERIVLLEKSIYDKVGEEFKINSPKQLGEILFGKLGIPGGKKTKTGFSTSADILEKLKDEYPVIADVLEYRQLTKLNSTYAEGLTNYILDDGRIHGRFNQTITATGRISSTEPNLQNIPVRMELGRAIRKVFVPKEGCVLVDADYSQIELRILAHMSGDENLIESYRESKDIHQITAAKVFHVDVDKVTKEQRSNAKAVNFGIVYGISSFGLSQDLSISKKEAEGYIKEYFATYPNIKKCLDGFVEKAKRDGYSVTEFGRMRPVPELKSSNFMQRSFGERIAMNSPIQGTAADIIKIAMVNVDRRLIDEKLKARIVLQVHDELLIEAPIEEKDIVTNILREEMSNAASLKVPLEVDVQTGNSWLEAH